MSAFNHSPVLINTTIQLNAIIGDSIDILVHICGTGKLQS